MILQLSDAYADPIPSISPPLEPQTLLPSGEYIKNTVNKRTTKISTSGISIVGMLHGYSRQNCTVGCLSATAGLLF